MFKAQSAMEYLMTYGWAILIIAVVLGALYSLHVFNPTTFAPKAQPGSCQVYRPNGPYSTSFINAIGPACGGEIPQFVASFDGMSGSTYYPANQTPISDITLPPDLLGSGYIQAFTYTAWFKTSVPFVDGRGGGIIDVGSAGFQWGYGGTLFLHQCDPGDDGVSFSNPADNGMWHFAAITYDYSTSNSLDFYLDNLSIDSSTTEQPSSGAGYIGVLMNCYGYYFNGSMANVQLYNISLSANEIQALYLEGIGGAPINLQNLVGWWPLNGNANDYSGNDNNGAPTNVIFTSSWESGYTAP